MANGLTSINVVVGRRQRRACALASQLIGVVVTYDDSGKKSYFFEDVEGLPSRHVVEWLHKHHQKALTV